MAGPYADNLLRFLHRLTTPSAAGTPAPIVNFDDHVFQCFDAPCGQKGDVIDLRAALHGVSLRETALDLVRTFGLQPCAHSATEKRNG